MMQTPSIAESPLFPFETMAKKEGTSLQDLRQSSFRCVREAIGDAQVVLIGEATHGTEEFYQIRAELTKTLLKKDGFDAVLCEGDFPPFFELNRYVGGAPPFKDLPRSSLPKETPSAQVAFEGFQERFPQWMWQNDVMYEFVQWLREFNSARKNQTCPVQLLGLDIYSMFQSMDEVLSYLKETMTQEDGLVSTPRRFKEARQRYATLNCFRPEAQDYFRAIYQDLVSSQSHNVTKVLAKLCQEQRRLDQIPGDGQELFNAIQNARVVSCAEAYYRELILGGDVTWNIRDTAFLEAIVETMTYIQAQKKRQAPPHLSSKKARVIVWAHNSHVGDARASLESTKSGKLTLGQLCRETFGKENVFIFGFSTHDGFVRAAKEWGGNDSIMQLNPSFENSVEYLLHTAAITRGEKSFGYLLRSNGGGGLSSGKVDEAAKEILSNDMIQRFVGVNYIRWNELRSHYTMCRMSEQYDFILHVDRTSALRVQHTPNHYYNHAKMVSPTAMTMSATNKHDLINRSKWAIMKT
eukprot:scaffold110004_cov33-Attheya_sp.AAC.3